MSQRTLAILHDKRFPLKPEEIQQLLGILGSVKYGSVTLIIQDGVVVQIDTNEKIRLK